MLQCVLKKLFPIVGTSRLIQEVEFQILFIKIDEICAVLIFVDGTFAKKFFWDCLMLHLKMKVKKRVETFIRKSRKSKLITVFKQENNSEEKRS